MPSREEFDALRARLDAAEAVLQMFLSHAAFREGDAAALKAAILRGVDILEEGDRPNPRSTRQAQEMRAFASRISG